MAAKNFPSLKWSDRSTFKHFVRIKREYKNKAPSTKYPMREILSACNQCFTPWKCHNVNRAPPRLAVHQYPLQGLLTADSHNPHYTYWLRVSWVGLLGMWISHMFPEWGESWAVAGPKLKNPAAWGWSDLIRMELLTAELWESARWVMWPHNIVYGSVIASSGSGAVGSICSSQISPAS